MDARRKTVIPHSPKKNLLQQVQITIHLKTHVTGVHNTICSHPCPLLGLFFKTDIWLRHGQLWAILKGTASLT